MPVFESSRAARAALPRTGAAIGILLPDRTPAAAIVAGFKLCETEETLTARMDLPVAR